MLRAASLPLGTGFASAVALSGLFALFTVSLSPRALASDDGGAPVDGGAVDGGADGGVVDSGVADSGAPDSALDDGGAEDAAPDAGPVTPIGSECTAPSQCQSGFCVDGVCCDTACTGQCEACDTSAVAGQAGVCGAIAGPPHGTRPPCPTGSAAEPCQAATCDGVSTQSCDSYAPETTSCGEPICVGGLASPGGFCDGHGQCDSLTAVDCTPYACGPYQCNTHCTSDTDCAAGYACQGTECVSEECDDAGSDAGCAGAASNGAGGGSSGGCAMSAPSRLGAGGGGLVAVGLAGAAFVAAGRRRRRARGRV